jgi:hypothetical protein
LHNAQTSMNLKVTQSTILAIVVLATAISSTIYFATVPAVAQLPPGVTTGPSPSTAPGGGNATGGGGDFAEFMQCLNAAGPSPAEEQVTACYDPIYGNGAGDEEAADEDGGDTSGEGGGGDTSGDEEAADEDGGDTSGDGGGGDTSGDGN